MQACLAKQLTMTFELNAVLTGGGKHQTIEMEIEIRDGPRILELDLCRTGDDWFASVIRVHNRDCQGRDPMPVGQRCKYTQSRMAHRIARGRDIAEHADQRSLAS